MAAAGEGTLGVYEAVGSAGCAAEDLLGSVSRMARAYGCRRVTLSLPAAHPLVLEAERAGASTNRGVDPRLLARAPDVQGAMAGLAPVLQRRLAASSQAAWTGSVGLAVDGNTVLLTASGGRLTLRPGRAAPSDGWQISLPAIGLTRAMLGTEGLASLAGARLQGADPLRAVLEALFPALDPHFWLADSI
jgi:hypothetical protein